MTIEPGDFVDAGLIFPVVRCDVCGATGGPGYVSTCGSQADTEHRSMVWEAPSKNWAGCPDAGTSTAAK